MSNVDVDGIQVLAEIIDGKEHGDPTPFQPAVGMTRPPSLTEQIRAMVRREFSEAAHNNDMETFEEADDFDVDDETQDPHTPYEAVFDPPPPPEEVTNGEPADKQGRDAPDNSGSGKSGKVGKGKPKPEPKPDDKGSVPEASVGDRDVEE